jgi:phage baseplate assembly protein W
MGSLLFNLKNVNKTINRNYVFKDVALDMTPTGNNLDIDTSLDYAAIQNGIDNMFLFLPGERVLFPDFGNNLYRYLYEPANNTTVGRLVDEIRTMFDKWEPRVKILDIFAEIIPDENTIKLEIQYSVPSLNKERIINFNKSINIRR